LRRSELESALRRRAARDPRLRTVREAAVDCGVPLWLVGGYVRDLASGRPADDIDLIATRRVAALVRALSTRLGRRGFRFRKRGVTTWRWSAGVHTIDLVDAVRRGLEGDLRRREFTLNAVAFELTGGTLADPLGGLRDLRAGRLCLPRPGVVLEDPLRALRAGRLMAQFPHLRATRAVRDEARTVRGRLGRLAVERVRAELDKLLAAAAPSRGLDFLDRLGLVDAVLPELGPMRHCVAGRDRPDVWRHTLDAVACSEQAGRRRLPGHRELRSREARRRLGWALLLHDVSKPETLAFAADGRPTFHGHEVLGRRRAERLLRRLRVPRAERRRIGRLVLYHLRPSQLAESGASQRGMRRLVRQAEADLPLLLVHAACDAAASGSPDARSRWGRLRPVLDGLLGMWQRGRTRPLPRLLDGHDVMAALGLPPGPRVGALLQQLADLQAEETIRTRAEALAWLSRQPVTVS